MSQKVLTKTNYENFIKILVYKKQLKMIDYARKT